MFVYLQHKTIESVLKRGENLDNLVDKSNDLSSASQVHIPLYFNVPWLYNIVYVVRDKSI